MFFKSGIKTLILILTNLIYLNASHFDGGIITAKPISETINGMVNMEFTLRFAWRRSCKMAL
jgi:hypothetical protein